mgnify:CR=1 FL=1
MKKLISTLILIILSTFAFAAGPSTLAKSERGLWPHALNTAELFDFASRMEILVYVKHINQVHAMDEATLKGYLGLKNVNPASVKEFSELMKTRLLNNMALAGAMDSKLDWISGEARTWAQLSRLSNAQQEKLPEAYKAWYADADQFYAAYAYEQYRLAALFPGITSEIMKLDDREYSGSEYADKRFIMTFDDGPTAAGGNTDKTLELLRKNGRTGIFFVLGSSLSQRKSAVTGLYDGMSVGAHGVEHKAHTKAGVWADLGGLLDTTAKLSSGEACWFRPPYGQRNMALIEFLSERGCQLMLWNIDSQDWNKNMSVKDVEDRMTSLMLMWRSGILLFHDVHAKAAGALPALWESFDGAGVVWE